MPLQRIYVPLWILDFNLDFYDSFWNIYTFFTFWKFFFYQLMDELIFFLYHGKIYVKFVF